MSSFSERLKELRLEKEFTQKDLGRVLRLSKNAITMYEKGERVPKYEKLEEIADVFNVDMDYLMGKVEFKTKYDWQASQEQTVKGELDYEKYGLKPIKTQKIPLLGEIACGVPAFANENFTSYIEASSEIKADFCLVANGDSMKDARIFEGDIVFIRKQEMVENGEIAVVIIGDEATLKRIQYDREAGELKLIPENNSYSTIRLFGEELNSVRILGKAVAFMSDVR